MATATARARHHLAVGGTSHPSGLVIDAVVAQSPTVLVVQSTDQFWRRHSRVNAGGGMGGGQQRGAGGGRSSGAASSIRGGGRGQGMIMRGHC